MWELEGFEDCISEFGLQWRVVFTAYGRGTISTLSIAETSILKKEIL